MRDTACNGIDSDSGSARDPAEKVPCADLCSGSRYGRLASRYAFLPAQALFGTVESAKLLRMSFKIVPRAGRFRRKAGAGGWGAGVVLLSLFVFSTVAAADSESPTGKILTLLGAAGEEYREGVEAGRIVRPIEYEEAKAFVEDARGRWTSVTLEAAAQREIDASLQQVLAAMTELQGVEAVRTQIAALRQRISELTGTQEEVYPPAPPSRQRGQALFVDNCSTCHGLAGDGRGENADKLTPRPANFTDTQFMRGETPYDFFHVITLGKRNSAMPAWGEVLSIQERWDLISYLWTLPASPGQLAEGQGMYLSHCAGCHGATGDGAGPWSKGLLKAVPDISKPMATARKSNVHLLAVLTDGIAGSPMPAFAHALSPTERNAVVAFLRMLSLGGVEQVVQETESGSPERRLRLAKLARYLASSYEQAFREGHLVDATELAEAVALADQVNTSAGAPYPSLKKSQEDAVRDSVRVLVAAVRGSAPVAVVHSAADAVATHLERSLPPATPNTALSAEDSSEAALHESARLLDDAVRAYAQSDARAVALVSDAYFAFEPVERHLGGVAPQLKAAVEEKFVRLRQALKKTQAEPEVKTLREAIASDYASVRMHLSAPATDAGLLLQAAAIVLREGFEIVLVIGALLGYVVKAGYPEMRRLIHAGTGLGIAASFATAFAFGELLRLTPGSASVLEAATMLLAALVLFWVSYWLVSKAEADRWQQYIRSKVHAAIAGRRKLALAGAAFLAVYREGFETVLFFQALLAGQPGGWPTISAGIVVGTCLLAVVYLLLRRLQLRLPIGRFFLVTGVFLYAMAAVFASQGVYELQEIGWIPLTALPWMPTLPLLGIFPTLETALVQLCFLGLLLYAVAVLRSRRRIPEQGEASDVSTRLAKVEASLVELSEAMGTLVANQQNLSEPERRLPEVSARLQGTHGQGPTAETKKSDSTT